MRISGPTLALLIIVLVSGLMVTANFYLQAEPGDLDARNLTNLSLLITLMLTFFILLVGTSRWWHPHLWKHGNSQKHHRSRRKHHRTHHGRDGNGRQRYHS